MSTSNQAEISESTFTFLNIDIQNILFNDFLETLTEGVVVTPNADHLIKLQKDREFFECYQNAEHIVCDSRVLMMLSRVLDAQNPIKDQIAGSDFFPAFCQYHSQNTQDMRVFLLGGSETTVVQAQQNINARTNSQIVIDGYSPPFGFEHDDDENQQIIDRINQSGATVLAVGVGAPKQEKWIYRHRDKMPGVKIFLAIGATIEFEAGGVKRAPKWMSRTGLEWAFRISQEPKRMFKRYFLDDMQIFWLVFKQKTGLYKNPWA